MSVASKPERAGSSASGFGPHVEELQSFFAARGVSFGSAADLKPFVERLNADASFQNEMASMVRTVIYRERDGLSRLELMELVTMAVGGPAVEGVAAAEVREAVRGLMAFVESVFRTRRNPGSVVEPVPQEQIAAEPVGAANPTADLFYRARKAAQGEGGEPAVEDLRFVEPERTETVVLADEHWHVPLESFAERGTSERGSQAWLWVAGICALLLAFSAGLFVHQRLTIPLRDPNQPYEAAPPEAAGDGGVPAAGEVTAGAKPSAAVRVAASVGASHAVVEGASAASAMSSNADLEPKYMAPARIGASPALMAAHLVYAPPPAYPMMAEMTRTQGRVTVEAVVGKDGSVIRAKAISGHRLLRGAALREVYARRYRPYVVNSRPVDVATTVTVDFRLKR